MKTIDDNITLVEERIAKAARRAGKEPEEITVIAVTKGVTIERIREAIAAGIRIFGENYIQEAIEKMEEIKNRSISWHFIGHLQKNKVRYAVEYFDMIQSVDSIGLAREIDKRAKKPVDVLLEINIAEEKTKGGVSVKEALELAGMMSDLEKVRIRGLMTIPPQLNDPELLRPYFITLRSLAERINRKGAVKEPLSILSMGMSDDFEIAIEEGATMVRIGRAIFGERPI